MPGSVALKVGCQGPLALRENLLEMQVLVPPTPDLLNQNSAVGPRDLGLNKPCR